GLRPLSDQEKDLSPEKHGVIVTRVEQDSFAEEIGMQDRDIILAINRRPVNSGEDVRKIQQTLKPGDAVAFRVARPALRGARGGAARAGTLADTTYLSGKLPEK